MCVCLQTGTGGQGTGTGLRRSCLFEEYRLPLMVGDRIQYCMLK